MTFEATVVEQAVQDGVSCRPGPSWRVEEASRFRTPERVSGCGATRCFRPWPVPNSPCSHT